MISEQNWPKHKTIWCKKVQFKIGLNAKCAIVQNWPEHGKPVQIDNQYKFGTNANSAGTKRSVQNVSVQIGQNKVSTSRARGNQKHGHPKIFKNLRNHKTARFSIGITLWVISVGLSLNRYY